MTEMSKVEEVAKALWEAEGVAYGWNETDRKFTWEQAVERDLFGVGPFRIFARAAIAAMRVPTEAMAKAGEDEAIRCSCAECCSQAYTAMIDASLKE